MKILIANIGNLDSNYFKKMCDQYLKGEVTIFITNQLQLIKNCKKHKLEYKIVVNYDDALDDIDYALIFSDIKYSYFI